MNILMQSSQLDMDGFEKLMFMCIQSYCVSNIPQSRITQMTQKLHVASTEALMQILEEMNRIVREILYEVENVEHLQLHVDRVGMVLDPKLQDMLVICLKKHWKTFRDALIQKAPSGPQLLDVDWRIDVKKSADVLDKANISTAILQFQIQEPYKTHQTLPTTTLLNLEMEKEELQVLLKGMHAIKEQLPKGY